MKTFDNSRFQKAYEQPPPEFFDAVEQVLARNASVHRPKLSKRLIIALAALVICLSGVATAVLYGTGLGDFLSANLNKRGVPVTTEATLAGDMAMVDVKVKEVASDSMSMYLTVEYSLKDAKDSAIIFGMDMEYVLQPGRATQIMDNHLDIAMVRSAKNIFWLTTNEFYCQDNEGKKRYNWRTEAIYQSLSTVVVMYWFDLRTVTTYNSYVYPESAGFPDVLNVLIAPQLQRYLGTMPTVRIEEEEAKVRGYFYPGDFTQVDAGDLHITVSPKRNMAQKTYRIANFPERVLGMRTVEATVRETPLLYCVQLYFTWPEDVPLPDITEDYTIFFYLLDKEGKNTSFLSHTDGYSQDRLAQGVFDYRLEYICIKKDGQEPSTLIFGSHWDEEIGNWLYVDWELM